MKNNVNLPNLVNIGKTEKFFYRVLPRIFFLPGKLFFPEFYLEFFLTEFHLQQLLLPQIFFCRNLPRIYFITWEMFVLQNFF